MKSPVRVAVTGAAGTLGARRYSAAKAAVANFTRWLAVHFAHAGDSRLYRINAKGIVQLTNDHSNVAEMMRRGILTGEEAASHPERSKLYNALGPSKEMLPFCDHVIPLFSGNEVVAGSTRMKAGTATKKALNFLSSTIMIRLGKVVGSYMVDVACINNKLVERAQAILDILYHTEKEEALAEIRAAKAGADTHLEEALKYFESYNQLEKVMDAINEDGQHAILYGERGVGKTSLANIMSTSYTNLFPVKNHFVFPDQTGL